MGNARGVAVVLALSLPGLARAEGDSSVPAPAPSEPATTPTVPSELDELEAFDQKSAPPTLPPPPRPAPPAPETNPALTAAEDYGEPDAPKAPRASRWYGSTIVIIDGIALATGTVSVLSDAPPLFLPALAGYLLGGPIVHGSHGDPRRVVGSLALRIGLPAAAALLSYDNSSCSEEFACFETALVWGAVGAVGAMIIDSALVSYESEHDDEPGASLTSPHLNVAVTPDRTLFLASGQF